MPPYDVLAAVLAEVQALRGEVAQLREALARRPAEKDEGSEALLEQISYEVGSAQFTAASLLEHSTLQCAHELRTALEEFFGPSVTAKRLGRWLGRMRQRGVIANRYEVEHTDDYLHRGGLWTVRICALGNARGG